MATTFIDRFQKAFLVDIIKGQLGAKNRAHLIRKTITNRLGRKQTVWVKPEEFPSDKELKFDFKYFNIAKRYKIDYPVFLATVRYFFANRSRLEKFLKLVTKKPWLQGKDHTDEALKREKSKKKPGTRKYSIALLKLLQRIYGDEYDRGRYPLTQQEESGNDGDGRGDGSGGAGIESISGNISGTYNFERYKSDGIAIGRANEQQFAKNNYIPESLSGSLKQHQADFVNLAIEKYNEGEKGVFNFDGTGAGKTRQALALGESYNKKKDKKVLIVTQNSTIIEDSFRNDSLAMGLGELNIPKDPSEILQDRINIIPYSQLAKYSKESFDLVIFDEAHNLKNESSAKSKHGLNVIKNSTNVCNFSATPLDKVDHVIYIAESLGMNHIQLATSMGYEYKKFNIKKNGVDVEEYRMVKDPSIPMEEVARRLNKFFTELTEKGLCTKREVPLSNLQLSINQSTIPPEFAKKYQAAITEYTNMIVGDHKKKGFALMQLNRIMERAKVAVTIDKVKESLSKGEQAVIFADSVNLSSVYKEYDVDESGRKTLKKNHFLEGTMSLLSKELKKLGIEHGIVAGGRGSKSKADLINQSIKDFQSGTLKVLIGTPKSGGTGISLDDVNGEAPRRMLIMTPPFSAVEFIQDIGRINRLTTKSKANAELITFKDSLTDEWTTSIIANKVKALGASVQGDYAKIDIDNLETNVDILSKDFSIKKPVEITPKPRFPKGLDHGVLNLPLHKRGGGSIDNQLDKYKKQKQLEDRKKQKQISADFKINKSRSKELFSEHGDAIAKFYSDKLNLDQGQLKVFKQNLDSYVKWQPSKFLAIYNKYTNDLPKSDNFLRSFFLRFFKNDVNEIDVVKGRIIKYKYKVATGNPKRPFNYFYDDSSYRKYLQTTQATKKTKKDIKNLSPHNPKPVSSAPTDIGIGKDEDVKTEAAPFQLTQEAVGPSRNKGISSEPNLFGITEQTERKYLNQNYHPKFNPAREIMSIGDLVTEVKSALLKEGMEARAKEWIDATYNTKSTMSNVLNLAYKFVQITSPVANLIRKQIIKASVNNTKQELIDPNARTQVLEEHGKDPETPVPRLNEIEKKEANKSVKTTGGIDSLIAQAEMELKEAKKLDDDTNEGFQRIQVAREKYQSTLKLKYIKDGYKVLSDLEKVFIQKFYGIEAPDKLPVDSKGEIDTSQIKEASIKQKEKENELNARSLAMQGNKNAVGEHKKIVVFRGQQKGSNPGRWFTTDKEFAELFASQVKGGKKSKDGEVIQTEISGNIVTLPYMAADYPTISALSEHFKIDEKEIREALPDYLKETKEIRLHHFLENGNVSNLLNSKGIDFVQTYEHKSKDQVSDTYFSTAPLDTKELDSSTQGNNQVVNSSIAIDPAKKILSFLQLLKNDSTNDPKSISLGKVNESVAKRIKELTGIDVSGFNHRLSKYDIKHILNSHGGEAEKLRGQIPLVESDLELIPQIIGEPDSIDLERKSHQGLFAVKYTKKIGSDYFVIEEIRKPKEELSLKTMYKRTERGGVNRWQNNPQHLTSETFPPADPSISESSEKSQAENLDIVNETKDAILETKEELKKQRNRTESLLNNSYDAGKILYRGEDEGRVIVRGSLVENDELYYIISPAKDKNATRLEDFSEVRETINSRELRSAPELDPLKIQDILKSTSPETRDKANKELLGTKDKNLTKNDWVRMSIDIDYQPIIRTIPFFDGNLLMNVKDYSGMNPSDIIPYDNKVDLTERQKPKWMPEFNAKSEKYRLSYTDIEIDGQKRFLCQITSSTPVFDTNLRSGVRYIVSRDRKTESFIYTQEQIIAIETFHLNKAKQLHKLYNDKRTNREEVNGELLNYSKRQTQMPITKMSYQQFDLMSLRLFGTKNRLTTDQKLKLWKHWKEIAEQMKYREIDLRLGFQDAYEASTYQKGNETSYGDSGTVPDILTSHGVLVKMQNGKPVDSASLKDIQTGIEDVYSAFGNRTSMAKKFGLKISHSGKKRMHASKAIGVFIPSMKAIGVSFADDGNLTLAHEFAHFMDHYLGSKGKDERSTFSTHQFASTGYGIENEIATVFRKGISEEAKKKEYWSRSTECFARALECYYSNKKGTHDARAGFNPNKEYFDREVLPLIEKFFEEKSDILKSFFANFQERKRETIKKKVLLTVMNQNIKVA